MTDTDVIYASRYSENGHWYDEAGRQIEGVPYADKKRAGEFRKPTLTDAKKHQWCSGVTTICGMADKPDLINWKVTKAIEIGARFPRGHSEDEGSWMQRCRDELDKLSKSDEGTAIHASVQRYLGGDIPASEHAAHVAGVQRALDSIGLHEWQSEVPCISRFGYGTKADLVAPGWLLDIKTKEGNEAKLQSLKPYEGYVMQLAATSRALPMNAEITVRRYGILFVSRDVPGDCFLREVPVEAVLQGWKQFLCLLSFYRLRTGYVPAWATLDPVTELARL